jgi:hypothetical protein
LVEACIGLAVPGRPIRSLLTQDPSAAGVRDRTEPDPGPLWVRGAPDHRGTSGHQRSPTVRRTRRSPAAQVKQQAQGERANQIVVPKVGSAPSGSRRAATGVRNDRGARPKTVEDHDRRCCH